MRLKTLRRKQNVASALGIQKRKLGGNYAYFKDNKASISGKRGIHSFIFYSFLELLLLNYL